VRGEELDILRRAAVPGLPLLVPRAFHDTLGVRLRAVQTLGTLGLPRYESVVVEALADESPVVAMIAARTLASPEYAHRVREVIVNIDRLQGWDRRFLAALLADFGEGGAPALRAVFVDENAPAWVRAVAGDALGRIPDPTSGGLAVDVLERDGVDREVVITGLRLLGVVGASEHVGPVRRLARDEDDVVRAVALSALGSLGDHSDVPLLEHSVRDPSPWVALNAARALSQMGQGDVVTDIAATERPGADIARQVLSEEEEEKVGET
jgi:HEAT repeat protein